MNEYAATKNTPRSEEAVSEDLYALEADDPEGHGPDIQLTLRGVAIGVACLVAAVAIATGIAWAVSGGDAAMSVLGGSMLVAVVLALPFGGVVVLRSNKQRDLERKAAGLDGTPARPDPRRPRRRWSLSRKFRRAEQSSTAEAKQRMDNEGGPVAGVPPVQDR